MDFEGLKDEFGEDYRRKVRQALFDYWECKRIEMEWEKDEPGGILGD